jgi:hypothetical protein
MGIIPQDRIKNCAEPLQAQRRQSELTDLGEHSEDATVAERVSRPALLLCFFLRLAELPTAISYIS